MAIKKTRVSYVISVGRLKPDALATKPPPPFA